jgi:nucleoside 2-deoxyribosyltransferase
MSRIYVAGPVAGRWRFASKQQAAEERLVAELYERLIESASHETELSLPIRDEYVDSLDPRSFLERTLREISIADAALTVLVWGDTASAVEATLISALRKPQIAVTDRPKELPRTILGLPGLAEVIPLRNASIIVASFIEDFVAKRAPALDNEWDMFG